MNSESKIGQRSQFKIWQIMVVTGLVAVAITFPEFAIAVPFAVGLGLLVLFIVTVVWIVALVTESPPGILRQVAAKNLIALAAFIVALLAYGVYGYYALNWNFG